jgi:DNA-binding transcriptional MerR regulator
MKESLYSIKDLETLSGVKAHTIRIWEKRYNLLKPQRTKTNIRYYCDEDLRKILNVATLVNHGFRISKVADLCNERIREEILNLDEVSKNGSDFIERLIVSTVNFDQASIHTALNNAIENFGFEKTFANVIFPFFEKIGYYWQVGSIFPAQEHYISNLIRQKLISEMDRLSAQTTRDETILFFLHENERHELSLLFYSLLALKTGFKVIYLGQNVPLDDLRSLQLKKKSDLIFTVFLNSLEKEELQDYFKQLSTIFSGKRVFVAGRQVSLHKPVLPRKFKIISSAKEFEKYLG